MNESVAQAIDRFCLWAEPYFHFHAAEQGGVCDAVSTPLLLELARRWDGEEREFNDYATLEAHFSHGDIKQLQMMSCAFELYGHCQGLGYELSLGELRRHALTTAIVALQMIPFFPGDSVDLLMASLHHDIGKAVLGPLVEQNLDRFNGLTSQRVLSFIEAEQTLLETNHPQVGAQVLARLGLPGRIVEGVLHHHDPQATDSILAHFVSLADTLTMTFGFATNLDVLKYSTHPELYPRYGIHPVDLQRLGRDAIDRINRVTPFIGGAGRRGE